MMVILDTDHMSLLQRGGLEQTRGWLARLTGTNSLERQIFDYSEIKVLLRDYCNIAVCDFSAGAAAEFQRLRSAKIRVGTMDLKIAAITLACNATLLTRNMTNFGKIPGLRIEDWSA